MCGAVLVHLSQVFFLDFFYHPFPLLLGLRRIVIYDRADIEDSQINKARIFWILDKRFPKNFSNI